MVAVIGIATSSEALVREKLAALGTNVLTVSAGNTMLGKDATLPPEAVDRVRRIDGVQAASSTALLEKIHVYRNTFVDPGATAGLGVRAADIDLLKATGSSVKLGAWFSESTAKLPTVVLGSAASERLGISQIGRSVWLGDRSFTVVGILNPSFLAPELDSSALVGIDAAIELFGFDGAPTTVYEKSDEDAVTQVRSLLPATVNPQAPTEVEVSRPSDALAAQNTVDQAFTGLLVGVGSIALLVGGIGVANTMVISVLERRREIGLRRSLGATRSHIRLQFLSEAVLLSAYGGFAGSLLGFGITAVVARTNGWPVAIPPAVLIAGVVVTMVVGAVAGVLPAIRAARTSPTAALSS